jgi:conjugative transfer region protein TrbK
MKAWLPLQRDGRGDRAVTVVSLVRFAVIACGAAIVIIAIGEASRTPDASPTVAPATEHVDPLAAELTRCRTVTAEQLAADDSCRRVWAESRRRFFAPAASVAPASDTPRKTQDRITSSAGPAAPDEAR